MAPESEASLLLVPASVMISRVRTPDIDDFSAGVYLMRDITFQHDIYIIANFRHAASLLTHAGLAPADRDSAKPDDYEYCLYT